MRIVAVRRVLHLRAARTTRAPGTDEGIVFHSATEGDAAKALKARVGPHAVAVAPRASVEVAEEAPPVYRWLGVAWAEHGTRLVDDDEPATAA